jgi:PAS domain S-box-containing protein
VSVGRIRLRGRVWPIRAYFALLVALFVTGAAAAAIYVDVQTDRDGRRAAVADARFAARTASGQLGDYVATLRATVDGLAANPQIEGALDRPQNCTLTFTGIARNDASHLDVIAADGTVACSSRSLSPGSHFRYQEAGWLRRARRGAVFVVAQRDAATGVPVAIAASPTPGGRAVIAGFMDLTSVGPELVSLYGGGDPVVFLVVSSNGTVLARSIAPDRWIGRSLAATPFARSGGGTTRTDLDGVRRLYAEQTVPGTDWRFYAGEDEEAALAAGNRLERRQLAIILVGLLAALLGAWFVHRQLVRPIRQLGDSLRSTGDEPVPSEVPVHGPAEVIELGSRVNGLISSVDRELRERERAEAAAATSARSYRLLFESNPNPMWVFDSETLQFLAVNDSAVEAYGYSRDEFLAMTIEAIRPPEDVAALREVALGDGASPRERGLNVAGVWRHLRKDGSAIDVEVTSHAHTFNGRPARVVLAIDVTERLRAEAALKRSEARYRDLFENATDLIATVDLDSRLTAVNRRFADALGYTAEELIGRPLLDLVPPEWHEQVAAARRAKLDEDDASTIYEHELVAKDGRRLTVEVSSRAITEDGRPAGVQAICRDITERRQLEEQLRQAQRLEAIGRLAGGVAHDFNNLLTVIGGYSEALLERNGAGSETELREISAAAERATALTGQLLAFSRRQVLQPRVVDVNAIVSGITPMLGRLIGEDVELATALDPSVKPVLADANQLEQVLVNLVVNARDAMPQGGKLTIETSSVDLDEAYVSQHSEATPGPHTVLAVSDTGVGMDAATTSRIFEPFFTTKPVGAGTGLGLSTVYGTVKQSGGSIWVYSEPGRGTTFKIYLPLATADMPVGGTAQPAPVAPTGTETILVVEDEPSLRTLVAVMLEDKGYNVVIADSSEQAIELADRERIDLLLTDLVMPRLSGRELATRIRAMRPSIRVLFMSGYADEAINRNGSLEPGAAFLAKPFTAAELAKRVRETLDTPATVPA